MLQTRLKIPTTLLVRAKSNHDPVKSVKVTVETLDQKSDQFSISTCNMSLERIGVGAISCDLKTATPEDANPIQALLVCTKAHDTLNAIDPLMRTGRINDETVVVLLQNGVLAVKEALARRFPATSDGHSSAWPSPIYCLGSTTHGVTRQAQFHIRHVGLGHTIMGLDNSANAKTNHDFGRRSKRAREILEALGQHGEDLNVKSPVSWIELRKALLLKVVVNSVLNPLTATLSCRNGALSTSNHGKKLISVLCKEASAILNDRLHLSPLELEAEVLRVADMTALNRNSMEVDIANSRDTEAEFIIGYLLNIARERGIDASCYEFVDHLVKTRADVVKTNYGTTQYI
ncbi:2-dehydropantoate 2-reductase (Ketopantoate reductase) (KPA reductase) (KPR) [Blyttiomyces sp. JEL0837]|nr:2-dehydropantoate 2-reductase (Ketopantoate reductase) (KPA reductase) (KPR) [Blyttiomyces sp. JEL0837]